MGTPAPGPPPRTAPAPPRPPPCAPGAARGRQTRPRAQRGADRARHPEADEAPMPWPTRWPGSPDLANFFRIGQPSMYLYLRDHTTNRRNPRPATRPAAGGWRCGTPTRPATPRVEDCLLYTSD